MASLLFLLKFLENFSWCTTQLDNKDKRVLLHEPVNYQIFMIKTTIIIIDDDFYINTNIMILIID